ncbi:hypothetical protein OSB04_001513, partial [Centaurea solstitialis]
MNLQRCGLSTAWDRLISSMVRICVWQARLGRLPFKDNLIKRGVLIEDGLCVLCNQDSENGDHVFVNYRKAAEVRYAVNRWKVLLPLNYLSLNDFCDETVYENHSEKEKRLDKITKQANIVNYGFGPCGLMPYFDLQQVMDQVWKEVSCFLISVIFLFLCLFSDLLEFCRFHFEIWIPGWNINGAQWYLSDRNENYVKDFDILSWWKQNAIHYPIVSRMAKDILAIQIPTAASESAFSKRRRVLDPYETIRKSRKPIIDDVDILKDDDIAF